MTGSPLPREKSWGETKKDNPKSELPDQVWKGEL